MTTLVLEIRAGEGGDDAKLLVKEFADAYSKLCDRLEWKHA